MNNELERHSVRDDLVRHIKSPLFEKDEYGTWCYYDDVIQIITQKDRQIEILKVERLKYDKRTQENIQCF